MTADERAIRGRLRGDERLRTAQGPDRSDELELGLQATTPEEAGQGTGRLRRESCDLLGRSQLVSSCGESLAGETEHRLRVGIPGRARERTNHEARLPGGNPREAELGLREGCLCAHQLEASLHTAVEVDWDQDCGSRMDALRGAPCTVRETLGRRLFDCGHVLEGQPRALELGGDGGRVGHDGTSDERAAGFVGDAHDHDLGAGGAARCLGEDLQRLREAPSVPERQSGLGERMEPTLSELGPPVFWTYSHPDPTLSIPKPSGEATRLHPWPSQPAAWRCPPKSLQSTRKRSTGPTTITAHGETPGSDAAVRRRGRSCASSPRSRSSQGWRCF